MRIRLLVAIVTLALMLISRPFSAYAVTISFLEPVAENAKVVVRAVDGGMSLPDCKDIRNRPPCVLGTAPAAEIATIVLEISTTSSLPVGTSHALLLENVQPLAAVSDLLTMIVDKSEIAPNLLSVGIGFASSSDPNQLFDAPKDFAFGVVELGGSQDLTRNIFTGPINFPAEQKQLFPPDKVPVPVLSIMAQSDVTVGEPEPPTWLLLGSGLAGMCALAWRQRRRR